MFSLLFTVLPVKTLAVKLVSQVVNRLSLPLRSTLKNVLLQIVPLIEIEAKKTPNKFDDIAVKILKALIQ